MFLIIQYLVESHYYINLFVLTGLVDYTKIIAVFWDKYLYCMRNYSISSAFVNFKEISWHAREVYER